MYTEFVFAVSLLHDTPKNVLSILDYLVNDKGDISSIIPNHEFFNCDRYAYIARCSSYYFGYSNSNSSFIINEGKFSNEYLLSIRSSVKNYSNEIDKFVDWIRAYVKSGSGTKDLLGYKLYEADTIPYLFYKDTEFEKLLNYNFEYNNF